MGFSKHTKKTIFSAKCFFFFTLMKNIFLSFKDFFHKKNVDLVKMCVFKLEYIKIECNDGLFLDVNLKTRFFEGQNRQSQQK